jgi:Arc/MetJ-type ribon-helix-helix transcriptional regulator
MNTITVKIPEDLEVRLAAEAESRHTTKSEVVRAALVAALRRSSGKGKRSAYAAMKGGCGLVKEGPPDLSTNKKHLREYGK